MTVEQYRPLMISTAALRCLVALALFAGGCGDDDGPGTEADRLGVGAVCSMDTDCYQPKDDAAPEQTCLEFKGGYCGLADCSSNAQCPVGSACILHDDNRNYCFRTCIDKVECNLFRGPDEESNCSSSVEFVDGKPADGSKACVPPSSS